MIPIVQVEGLTYRYLAGSSDALHDVSFTVEPGEFLGVIGPNRSGKSTLCLALVGLVPQFFRGRYAGTVIVAGKDAARTPVHELARSVGIVFQNPFTQLSGARSTVEEEIAFGLEQMGVPPAEMRERVAWAMEQVGITHLRDKNPFLLSGGESQRLAIACMLAQQPQLLVLDEPTSQLDPRGTSEVFACVGRLRADGLTVVMVEHDIDHLAAYADRLLLLVDGRAQAWGSPGDVLTARAFAASGLRPPAHVHIASALAIRDERGAVPLALEDAAATLRRTLPEPASGVLPPPPDERHDHNTSDRLPARGGHQTAPRIELSGVRFAYPDGTQVFEGLDLVLGGTLPGADTSDDRPIADGLGPIALIGENGAGKTTLVKLIAGLLRPQEGDVSIGGQSIRERTAATVARTVGLVFQNPDDQLFKSRVLDEAMFGALNLGVSKDEAEARAREALAQVGLAALAEENPYDLSLGERKMLALASVLAMRTPILILDEPTIAQDAPSSERIGQLVCELRDAGRLVIVVTHDMDFVARFCRRVVVMARGRVLAAGPTLPVFTHADLLEHTGLEPPAPLRLARLVGLPATPLTPSEFVEAWNRLRAAASDDD